MKEKPPINQNISVSIERLGIHGEGIGYWHGYTVFVDGALPGEQVQARLVERKKNYGRGKLIKVEHPSPSRVTPPCPLFGRCGGCQLMHLAYEAQLDMKRQRVVDALERIGKFAAVEVPPCRPSPSELSYRNKVQVPTGTCPEGVSLGFFARGSHDLVEVEHCYIHSPLGERVFSEIREIIKHADVTAYDWNTGDGELRFVIIKTAVNTGQVLVVLVTTGRQPEKLKPIAQAIMKRCPAVKGVVHNVNAIPQNVVLGEASHLLAGDDRITETLSGMNFTVSPASFFQVNPAQAEHLYATAVEFAGVSGEETVLDAFCGVGTLTLLLSKGAKRVIGIECVPQTIEDAKANATLNEVSNVRFVCADAEAWIKKASNIDVAVLNPPRKGCEPSFLDEVGRLMPRCVVYISCDPATLARDLAHLRNFGYGIEAVQPLDMFPQTAHVETVVKMIRL